MKLVQLSATEAEKYISGRMTVSVHCIRGIAGCVLQEDMKKHREACCW